MSYKIIVIFALLLFVFDVLVGIPFGIWLANDESIFNSPMFYLAQYMSGFVVNCFIFYFLFMQKITKPVQHALITGMLSWLTAAYILYVLTGIKPMPLLVVVDVTLTALAISLALYIAKIRGKLYVCA